jgi:hypothetical protein
MLGRSFRIALLLFQVVWLNAIVPGHRRGIVLLSGESCPQCDANQTSEPACCVAKHKGHPQKPGDASQCAICSFAARVTLPPTIDFRLDLLEELDRLAPPVAEPHTAQCHLPTYLGRAPPVAA